jgi:4-hydroxy-3-methylbut-2-enyl diphosphate reductase
VVVVSPRGFCAGVVRAITTVERALAIFPPPVYVRRAIVHNARVVARLAAAGAVVVDEVEDVPPGGVVVFSAHGVSADVYRRAASRGLRVVDATCPLVMKAHQEVRRYRDAGDDVVLIGHAGHDEVIGTLGQAAGVQLVEDPADVAGVSVSDSHNVACVTQTTLCTEEMEPILAALEARFPQMARPAVGDICYATSNRQAAARWLARNVDIVLVIGDPTSSNSRRLRHVAAATGTPAHMISGLADLRDVGLSDRAVVGVTAGASTPADVVEEVVDHFRQGGAVVQEKVFVHERTTFRLPRDVAPMTAHAGIPAGAGPCGPGEQPAGRPLSDMAAEADPHAPAATATLGGDNHDRAVRT